MKIELPLADLQTFINKKSEEVELESLEMNKIRLRVKKFRTSTTLEINIIANDSSSVLLEYKIVSGIMARLFNVMGLLKAIIGRVGFVEPAGSRNEYLVHPFQIPALAAAGKDFTLVNVSAEHGNLVIEVKPI